MEKQDEETTLGINTRGEEEEDEDYTFIHTAESKDCEEDTETNDNDEDVESNINSDEIKQDQDEESVNESGQNNKIDSTNEVNDSVEDKSSSHENSTLTNETEQTE
ncbi:hypothetical protein J6590_002005 [Homalodisca vitripennis]|nr:hypothetical protein J6590_002005 [Homalodisca vitripennis]